MIAALRKILREFGDLFQNKKQRKLLLSEINKKTYLSSYIVRVTTDTKWKALREAIGWLKTSQDAMKDDGFGTYYLQSGWTSSYPETSGYIVPTILNFAKKKVMMT